MMVIVVMTVTTTKPVLTLSMRNELKRFGNSGEECGVLKVVFMGGGGRGYVAAVPVGRLQEAAK
jgi:hypothetical protein